MDYQMFTDAGNEAVGGIVYESVKQGLSWGETYAMLQQLAQRPGYGEATDTAVRDMVYEAIGAEEREESFWV
jgi:hypothetical protein